MLGSVGLGGCKASCGAPCLRAPPLVLRSAVPAGVQAFRIRASWHFGVPACSARVGAPGGLWP
eukprot:10455205-Alexandrium_andersonii.AAC.1